MSVNVTWESKNSPFEDDGAKEVRSYLGYSCMPLLPHFRTTADQVKFVIGETIGPYP